MCKRKQVLIIHYYLLQAFLSKLYTYLVDEMHDGLGKVFSLEQPTPDPPNVIDCDMLRQYALESEVRWKQYTCKHTIHVHVHVQQLNQVLCT